MYEIFFHVIFVYTRLSFVIFAVDWVRVRSGRMNVAFHDVWHIVGHRIFADSKEIQTSTHNRIAARRVRIYPVAGSVDNVQGDGWLRFRRHRKRLVCFSFDLFLKKYTCVYISLSSKTMTTVRHVCSSYTCPLPMVLNRMSLKRTFFSPLNINYSHNFGILKHLINYTFTRVILA